MSRATRLRRMESSFVAVPRVADYTSTRVKWATRSLIAITAILFIGAIAIIAQGSSSPVPQPRYERFAQVAAGDWLAGRNLSVPAVPSNSSSGETTPFSSIAPQTTNGATTPSPGQPALDVISSDYWRFQIDSTGNQPYTETDHFLVQTASTGFYDLAISVDDIGGVPILAGPPNLAPTGFANRPNVQQVLPTGWKPAGLSAGETNQIHQWAQSYVTGNSQTLYELTGDSRATHYVGLGGKWSLSGQPNITQSWGNAKTNTAIARVQLTVTLNNQTFGVGFDLLIGDVSQRNLPPIQAWGPTGTGFTLRPYTNAIAGATG